jgi:predicted RNA binding protein YcfA (HicA-like mRNA interferase family)
MRKLDTELKLLGFKLVRVGKHRIYRNDNGLTLTMAQTPSDHRALKNVMQFARRVTRDPSTHPALRRKEQK